VHGRNTTHGMAEERPGVRGLGGTWNRAAVGISQPCATTSEESVLLPKPPGPQVRVRRRVQDIGATYPGALRGRRRGLYGKIRRGLEPGERFPSCAGASRSKSGHVYSKGRKEDAVQVGEEGP